MMSFEVVYKDGVKYIKLFGICDFSLPKQSRESLSKEICDVSSTQKVRIDFSGVSKIDFIFCAFLYEISRGYDLEFIGTSAQIEEIFDTLRSSFTLSDSEYSHYFLSLKSFLYSIGSRLEQVTQGVINFLNFCGMCFWYFLRSLFNFKHFKLKSLVYHMNESGFKALPVGLLTVFIVSYAIALQGVLQLEKMGVPIMSVEIIAKLSLREMGPFIVAIVVAGRSSSAFSAQLGVMNLTEENSALKTMNLSLFDYLVLPRLLALVLVMPLLVFLADGMSLFASMLAVKSQTGINSVQYLERFYEYVSINNFWVGICKAPFFGAAIALVGCFRGLHVKGDTESIGKETTKSVVNALFWIILINAVFSVITTRLDI